MNRAERLAAEGEGRRGNRVGFALTVLQRASRRARRRSISRSHVAASGSRTRPSEVQAAAAWPARPRCESEPLGVELDDADEDLDDDIEDLDGAEVEELEEQLVDQATSARTIAELEHEIATLARLEALADRVRQSQDDKKWTELLGLLADAPEMIEAGGTRRKLIIFTEHRDTLNYLVEQAAHLLGRPRRSSRSTAACAARSARAPGAVHPGHGLPDPGRHRCRGEGINLQRAHLMVNYDLPWNPNRIEQRFGRIHRIGQTEVCHMWNLVADETREGQVYRRLLEKLSRAATRLGGPGVRRARRRASAAASCATCCCEAIRYGNQPEVRARLNEVIDAKVGDGLAELVREHALSSEVLSDR